MQTRQDEVPAAPDTGYFPNEKQQAEVAATARKAREAVLAAEQDGAQRVCVPAGVPARVLANLREADQALWNAAAALNLAGLGRSGFYREVEAAARQAELLQQRLAVQMYV